MVILILNFYTAVLPSQKEKIISQLQLTNNLSFNFIQKINNKDESGKCIVEYPKKIYCLYSGKNKKIIVSNGRSLVIKNMNGKNYYFYPLKKTPLEYLLDKDYLISKVKTLKPREVDNKYINFKIFENDNEINLFFDNKNLNLIGWQTEDIYQNLAITFISSVRINQVIDKKKFILPENN
tara:strand:- start:736 stop:1275 length:540 start_codon:yes stop_codon:yes gene_type:complete